jgi:hypothetical protein
MLDNDQIADILRDVLNEEDIDEDQIDEIVAIFRERIEEAEAELEED